MKDPSKRDSSERLANLIRRHKITQGERCHLLITRQKNAEDSVASYKLLAALLKEGYFSTIVTMNTHTRLEEALEQLHVPPSAYQVVIFGRDDSGKVAIALDGQERGICIIKLPTHEDASFIDIQASLRSYLHGEIVIVGCISGMHRAVIQALTLEEQDRGSIYYVVPEEPCVDTLATWMQKRYKHHENFLISGLEGIFANFFQRLAEILLHNNLPSPKHAIIPDNGQHTNGEEVVADPASATGPLPDDQALAEERPRGPAGAQPDRHKEELPPAPMLGNKSKHERPPPAWSWSQEDLSGAEDDDYLIKSGPLQLDPSLESISNISNMKNAISQLPWPASVDVLIVTVTDIELKAILARYPGRVRRPIGEKSYYDLGLVGQARTFAVQANIMGPMEAQITVDEGIRALSPQAVIMAGIAFGVAGKGQQIGDVLVSKLIHDYDTERVGTGENDQILSQQRGTRVMASGWLIDRFNANSYDWPPPPEIHFGSILSGSKLVDNRAYQNALLRSAPDAIGGEMEGVGLSMAANRHRVSWLLVKGIADWGDGTKGESQANNQRLAADNAASFVLFVIGQDDFMRKP